LEFRMECRTMIALSRASAITAARCSQRRRRRERRRARGGRGTGVRVHAELVGVDGAGRIVGGYKPES